MIKKAYLALIEKVVITLAVVLLLYLTSTGLLELKSFALCALFANVFLVFRLSTAPFLQLILSFISLYPLYVIAYAIGYSISDYHEYQTESLFFDFLNIHMVFLLGLAWARKSSDFILLIPKLPKFTSNSVALIIASALGLMVVFFRGEVVLFGVDKYQVYVNNLRVESGLPEYGLVLLVLLLIVTPPLRVVQVFVAIVITFYLAKLFLLGYRVQLLMAMLALFYFYGERYLKKNFIVGLFFLGFIFFSFLGYIKETGLEEIYFSKVLFDDSPGFIISHHTGVLYSSVTNLGLLDSGVIDQSAKIKQALGLGINAIVPSRFVNDWLPEANMALFIRTITSTAGGLYAPVAIFTAFGWLGVFGFGFVISWLYHSTIKISQSIRFKLQVVFLFGVLVTFPRWLSYDIGNFFMRLPIYMVILVSFLFVFEYLSRKDRGVEADV